MANRTTANSSDEMEAVLMPMNESPFITQMPQIRMILQTDGTDSTRFGSARWPKIAKETSCESPNGCSAAENYKQDSCD